jgi:hypothetical protein
VTRTLGFEKGNMKLQITMEMDNDAFFLGDEEPARNAEAARILHLLAQNIERALEMEDGHGFALIDYNGNKVGQAEVTGD